MNNEKLETLYGDKEVEVALQYSLKAFIKTIHFQHFHTDFVLKDFHITLINYLWKYVYDLNNTKHLIINIPVRCGKSQIVVHFIKWLLYNRPKTNIIYTSYNKGLVLKYSKEIRDDLQSKLIGYDIEEDTKSKENWKIKGKGEFLAKTFNSGLTGRGADFIIIDDPLDANNYNSQAEKQNVIDTYEAVIKSRLDNKLTGRIILIMQRLATDDLTNYLTTTYKDEWEQIKIPEKKKKGESIFEEKLPLSFLLKEKEYNNFNFNSQYMQEPINPGGNVIKIEWFKEYEYLPKLKQVYITGDTAFKTKEANDYSVFQLWGKDKFSVDANYYLIDMIRGKWESPELLNTLLNFYEKWKSKGLQINYMSIEDKASGIGLNQQIKRLSIPLREFKIDRKMKDKYIRLMDVLPRIASGYVYIPKVAPWKLDFLNECAEFRQDMSHKHDDIIDATVIGLNQQQNITLADFI